MNMRTGLFGLGLLVVAGALTISCGGSDDGGDDTSKAGTNSTSGSATGGSSTAGSSTTTAGTNSSGGTNSNGGTNSTAGTNTNGGTNSNGGTNNNGNAGEDTGPTNGGAGAGEECPATAPEDGTACTREGGFQNACPYGTAICTCQGRQNREWNCQDFNGGAGGAGGGQLECPAAAPEDGADCGETPGFCPYQDGNCVCDQDGEWNCF